MKDSIIILCGGGPAPGMNTVVCSVAKTFIEGGYRVIGLHGGYSGLFNNNPRIEDIDFFKADAYFNRGGSYLQMSRFKPTDEDFEQRFNLELFQQNNIKLLVTVGGDDTASTANRIAKFLEAKKYPIANIHVPKTIDNDLPLPNNTPTFGFNSAKQEGAHIARTIYEDARTSGNWLLISAMGRSAGHLALGIGEATHCPMTIIPEMFNKTDISIDKIIKLTLSAIIKRKIMGVGYGTVVVAEGVFHDLAAEDIKAAGVHMTYDEQGCPIQRTPGEGIQEGRHESQDPPRRDRIRRPLPGSYSLRPFLLLRTRDGCLRPFQERRDRLHGVCRCIRQLISSVSARPSECRGQDSSPQGRYQRRNCMQVLQPHLPLYHSG